MDTREVVIELLSQLGSSREAREYLSKYGGDDSQFAVIKVGGDIIRDNLQEVAGAIGFLQHVGLSPIVIHGAGSQLTQALTDAGVQSEKIDGVRVTSPEAMSVIRPVIYEQNQRLVGAMEKIGIRARSIQHGVFDCDYRDKETFGLVGEVSNVRLEPLRAAVKSGALPVVSCLGETSGGQMLNVNADTAAAHLVRAIKPQKVIFLSPTGGLLDKHGRIMSAINLTTDYEKLLDSEWVHSGMRLKLIQIAELLADLPPSSSVSITSAANLTRELFTHRGAGTLIRRGEGFVTQSELPEGKRPEFKALIDECFGRSLTAAYFDAVCVEAVIWAASGRAVAVIDRGHQSIPYLDKFAVTPSAQGEGVGATLWLQMRRQFRKLYWRSREGNPINSWYLRHADFSVRRGKWYVFGFGVDDMNLIGALANDAANRDEFWDAEEDP